MPIVLDHFLILTDVGAPEAELLSEFGFLEGPPNIHPGQGTANRRFFFRNAMLELIYIRDQEEAQNGSARRLRLFERRSSAQASPFGVALKASDTTAQSSFQGWRYYPEYLGSDKYLLIGDNSEILNEPLCILIPADLPPSASEPLSAEPFTSVSELRLGVPVAQPSSVLAAIGDIDGVTLELNVPHQMEVVFNDEREGLSKDFRPALPLRIRW